MKENIKCANSADIDSDSVKDEKCEEIKEIKAIEKTEQAMADYWILESQLKSGLSSVKEAPHHTSFPAVSKSAKKLVGQ